jgi:hypothetical protein
MTEWFSPAHTPLRKGWARRCAVMQLTRSVVTVWTITVVTVWGQLSRVDLPKVKRTHNDKRFKVLHALLLAVRAVVLRL